MPGVIVTTAVRTGPTNTQTAATATMFVAGLTERGPWHRSSSYKSFRLRRYFRWLDCRWVDVRDN